MEVAGRCKSRLLFLKAALGSVGNQVRGNSTKNLISNVSRQV